MNTLPEMSEMSEISTRKIHIRVQQRTGKKVITTVQGLDERLNFELLLKAFKSEFGCNGTILEDEEHGKIIQLQGDKRSVVYDFLLKEEICTKDTMMVHGF